MKFAFFQAPRPSKVMIFAASLTCLEASCGLQSLDYLSNGVRSDGAVSADVGVQAALDSGDAVPDRIPDQALAIPEPVLDASSEQDEPGATLDAGITDLSPEDAPMQSDLVSHDAPAKFDVVAKDRPPALDLVDAADRDASRAAVDGARGFDGAIGSGGSTGTGGLKGSGGATGSGGASATGGVIGSGGAMGSGGAGATGGVIGSGGAMASGGANGTGGLIGSGGRQTGGSTGSGGGMGGSGGSLTAPPPIALPGTECTPSTLIAICNPPGGTCYLHCGPEEQGYKSVTCSGGQYSLGTCTFSSTTNYACYSVDTIAPCGATPPSASGSCSIPDCQPCGSGTSTGYYDSSDTPKVGYCVCSDGRWSCASTLAWPCPGRTGC